MAWVNALAAPLHDRLAWRLADVVLGILLASGRRTAASWWRAAAVGERCRSSSYFLDAVGRKVRDPAAVLLRIVLDRVDAGQRLVFALDDTPPKRYGPTVQGAGIHHHPTPGPAGAKCLYGHSWVVLSRIVRHADFGVIGLPLLGLVDVRKKDVPPLPAAAQVSFQTKRESTRGWSRGSACNCHRNRSHPGWPGTASPRNGSSSNQRSRPVSWWSRGAARTRRCTTCRR